MTNFNEKIINELMMCYKDKILNLVSLLQDKIVVFDFDGTLTEFKYNNQTLLPCNDNDLYEYSKENNIYENVYILKTMQYIINNLNPENIYILSVTVETLCDNKRKCINKYFPTIKNTNIIQVQNAKEKIVKLKNIYNKEQKQIIFLEDTAKTLLVAEETLSFVKGFHISSLLP